MVGAEAGDPEERAEVAGLPADPLLLCGPAGALVRGDGFDDKAAGLAGVDGLGRKLEGLSDEGLDAWRVEQGGIFELDVAALVAGALEITVGVAEAGAVLQEKEADPARIEGDGEEGVGGAIGGRKTDGESVVVVVDQLLGTGEAGTHAAEGDAGLGGDLGGELIQKSIELGDGGCGGSGRFSS